MTTTLQSGTQLHLAHSALDEGFKELTAEEIAMVSGGLNWGSVYQGAAAGAIGGAIAGAIGGGPIGMGGGAIGGAFGGGLASIFQQVSM